MKNLHIELYNDIIEHASVVSIQDAKDGFFGDKYMELDDTDYNVISNIISSRRMVKSIIINNIEIDYYYVYETDKYVYEFMRGDSLKLRYYFSNDEIEFIEYLREKFAPYKDL